MSMVGSHAGRWFDLIVRGARVLKREGLLELTRRIQRKSTRRIQVFGQKIRLRMNRRLLAQTSQVNEIQVRAPLQPHQATVNIVICAHNALADVQRCLESVGQHTTLPYSLILVDDGSDAPTQTFLCEFANTHRAALLRNDQATGYTRAANQGLRRSSADIIVLLNSDTIVTDQWLDRIIACAESNPRIGLVGPLSNTASWQSIPDIESDGDWALNPLPADVGMDAMARLVAKSSARLYPPMPLLNGFCLMIRRAVINQIGYFDEENFGPGYGEENDYLLRACKAGWLAALADDAYVYHAQSRSYSNEKRKELSSRAGALLAKKHGQPVISDGVSYCRSDRVLEGIRARSRAMFARQQLIEKGKAEFAGRRMLFLLPLAWQCGGGNIVVSEAHAMQSMGVEVRIFNLAGHRNSFSQGYPDLEIPVIYGEREQVADLAREYDAVIATVDTTVEWLAPLSGKPVRGYYVQDFEPYIYNVGTADYQKALASYSLFPDLVCFTKTEWTRQEMQTQVGVPSAVVGASVDIDLFRPRPRTTPEFPARPLRIVAMIRPVTPRRAPKLTMELLRRAMKQFADVEAVIFGTALDDPGFLPLPHDFAWNLVGMLTQKQVAALMNDADIFVDFSEYQAMGLTALEAMGCGAAVIVPQRGGSVSFARNGENSLVVDTASPSECWRAVQRLIEDHALRARLQRNALADVCNFYSELPAYNILSALFRPERMPQQ
jgi:GT2 family glycosyltransferase/glycosyltransferase involved in cell wall biosynthesis